MLSIPSPHQCLSLVATLMFSVIIDRLQRSNTCIHNDTGTDINTSINININTPTNTDTNSNNGSIAVKRIQINKILKVHGVSGRSPAYVYIIYFYCIRYLLVSSCKK